MPTPREQLVAARIQSGLSPNDMAAAIGLNAPAYCDLEAIESEIFMLISLAELRKICAMLRITPRDVFSDCGSTKLPTKPHNFAALADELREHLHHQRLSLDEFEEAAGWEVGTFLENPRAADTWSIDCLRDVCRELAVDWLGVLSDIQQQSAVSHQC